MLTFGYNAGLPTGTTTAWGCRAIIDQTGHLDVPSDRQYDTGEQSEMLLDHLDTHAWDQWRRRASELLRTGQMQTRVAAEFVLYEDTVLVVKGNTLASGGYLYVCAYLRDRDDNPTTRPPTTPSGLDTQQSTGPGESAVDGSS